MEQTEQSRISLWFQRHRFLVGASLVLFLTMGLIFFFLMKSSQENLETDSTLASRFTNSPNSLEKKLVGSEALRAGKRLANNNCDNEGVPYLLSVSPMEPDDFSFVVPYGILAGGHITPVDHQYFAPKDYDSPVDSYEVFAMADARLTGIQSRYNSVHPSTEYRLVFSVSCTFLYYYDLVTSLTPDLKTEFDKHRGDGTSAGVDIPVTAGQLIGRIGGRTLDFAVWDTTKPLTGFIVPEHYQAENWKIYTADPLDYYTEDLRAFILSRYVRTAEPRSGKIDYDIDGKLIGNWFLEGSTGYGAADHPEENSFTKHLAIVPDWYDPTQFWVSVGALFGKVEREQDMQQTVRMNTANPAAVDVETGLIKYDLAKHQYLSEDGEVWFNKTLVSGVTVSTEGQPQFGCALFQLLEIRRLEFEIFLDKVCTTVPGFTAAATFYTR
ncbi:hypothetical protein HY523_01635 [Candidatus Berkelbacteria bacterium]|nr:hypothetical protein [Candidatus Berkelbacteria bacterium]